MTRERPGASQDRTRFIRRIVLAEDDRSLRDVLVSILEADGYVVLEVEDGAQLAEAIAKRVSLASERPWDVDLIISDVRMPGLSGLEVLELFRKADRKTPFILITAFGSEELHDQARKLGATAHLDKPFDLDDLMMMVRLLAPLNGETPCLEKRNTLGGS